MAVVPERHGTRHGRALPVPTGRGVLLALLAVALWLLGDLLHLQPPRALAAALLLMLAVSAVSILLLGRGLRARREVLDEAVVEGGTARVLVHLDPRALVRRLPLGRGVVREELPEALGGPGDLALDRAAPHVVPVRRRGVHPLGPYALVVRDALGLFHLERRVQDDALVVGLPRREPVDEGTARAVGIARDRADGAASGIGPGEIGPIARPYAAGDDMRRVHWRATARAGRLMTREEEPVGSRTAVLVLDTRRPAATDPDPSARQAAEDRLVSHAASLLDALGEHGWEVRVVDADGDEITRAVARRTGRSPSPVGLEVDARALAGSLRDLAEIGFGDADALGAARPAPRRHDHAAGHTACAIALGVDDGDPFGGLELDRFAGRAVRRTAIALDPVPGPSAPRAGVLGTWTLVRGDVGHALADLLQVASRPAGVR